MRKKKNLLVPVITEAVGVVVVKKITDGKKKRSPECRKLFHSTPCKKWVAEIRVTKSDLSRTYSNAPKLKDI